MTYTTLSFRVDEDMIETLDRVAEKHDSTRSEVARHALDNGLRAHKYYPEFSINPNAGTPD
mgnify:FL=1